MKLNVLAAADALLKAAGDAAAGHSGMVLTSVESSMFVAAAPMVIAEANRQRAELKAKYAVDPGGVAARLLPGLSAVFDGIAEIVA